MNYLKENKVKKKLVLATALLAVGIATNVKADSDYGSYSPLGRGYYGYDDYTSQPQLTGKQEKIGFRTDWADASNFGVKPIEEMATEIKVKTAPGALVMVTLTLKEAPKVTLSLYELNNIGSWDKPQYDIKPTIAGGNGVATFDLGNSGTYIKKNGEDADVTKSTHIKAQNGDTFTVTVSIDGWTIGSESWTVGESKARDIEEREAKAKEEEEQKEQKTQAEVTSSGLTNQTNENGAESQAQGDIDPSGIKEQPINTQNDENRQEEVNDSSQREEHAWTTRFTSTVKIAWYKVKTWFKSWWS